MNDLPHWVTEIASHWREMAQDEDDPAVALAFRRCATDLLERARMELNKPVDPYFQKLRQMAEDAFQHDPQEGRIVTLTENDTGIHVTLQVEKARDSLMGNVLHISSMHPRYREMLEGALLAAIQKRED